MSSSLCKVSHTTLGALKWKGRRDDVVDGRGGDSLSDFGRCNRVVAVTTLPIQ